MLTLMFDAVDDLEALELHFEHSLVSLSKWESVYRKPFFSRDEMTKEEFLAYLGSMILDKNPPENFIARVTPKHVELAKEYINDPHTATTFREDPNAPRSREVITAEVIYYWLISFNIPFKPCDEWHLNQLMTLVRICGIKQSKPRKMTRQQQMAEYRRLNQQRREELGTTG